MTKHEPQGDPVLERLVLDHKPGPAARLSSARAQAMVQAALDAGLADLAAEAAAAESADRTREGGKRLAVAPWLRALAMAAGALLMLVGGAAAAKLAIETLWPAAPPEPSSAVEIAPARPRVKLQAPEPAVEQTQAEVVDQQAVEQTLQAKSPAPLTKREARELDTLSEDLLQQANRARAAGEFRKAADLYAEVYERHAGSLPAYVAQVAAGSLELEHLDRPERAVRLFRKALKDRSGAALDLEARQGLATALRDLGRTREEVAALQSLIAAHADRPAAERARARLAELRGMRTELGEIKTP